MPTEQPFPRGQSLVIAIPSEGPLGGLSGMLGVLVMDGDVHINEWEIGAGDALRLQVGGSYKAYMQRIGEDTGHDVWLLADPRNKGNIRIGWEEGGRESHKWVKPGEVFKIDPFPGRHWTLSATKWEG